MDSEFILIARAIDEKIKYMESKLEKPYLIGFNHNSTPAEEAEKIVDNLMKEIDAEIEEQKDIENFLDEEIRDMQASNEEYKKILADTQSQLEEFETYACSNVPGYQKFVPPPPPSYVPTDPSELGMDQEVISPVHLEQEEVDLCVQSPEDLDPNEDNPEKDNDMHQVENVPANAKHQQIIDAPDNDEQNSFDENSLVNEEDLFPNESQMDLVASPLMDNDHFKPVVAKKLDFDQLSVNLNKIKPFACSTEKKSKSPVKKAATQKKLPEGIENLSGIQNIHEEIKEPKKPVRKILGERQPANRVDKGGVAKPEKGGAKPDATPYQQDTPLIKDLPLCLTNLIRDTVNGRSEVLASKLDPLLRRDTLGGLKELPGLSEGLRRDTLGGRSVLPSGLRHDTLSGRKDLPRGGDTYRRDTLGGTRRETLGGKELPSGPRDGFQRDTLGLGRDTRNLPTGLRDGTQRDTFSGRNLPTGLRDGFQRDTLSRETLSGRNLPTGLRDGFQRDTLSRETLSGRNLPTGLRDGTQRDTLGGEGISSRRLSHYRVVPKMRFGTLPSPPKQPVMSELGRKMIGKFNMKMT